MVFLFYGVGKLLMGPSNFAGGLQEQMAQTPLPAVLVGAFGTVLPYWETLVGTLLLGIATELGLTLAGILMVLLTLGTVLQQNAETVAHNLLFAFLVAVLLWMGEHNRYSVDGLRRARNHARALREPASTVNC